MSEKFRLPNINAPTDGGKLEQIRSYLYQLAQQMNRPGTEAAAAAPQTQSTQQLQQLFGRLRPLIARSGEICDAYRQRLESAFGQTQTLTWQTPGVRRVQSCFESYDETEDSQHFLVFGILSGKAAQQTLVVRRSGAVLTTGELPAAVARNGQFTLTGKAGDSLTLLSDRSFRILED